VKEEKMGAVVTIIVYVLYGLFFCIIGRFILSWVDPQNRWVVSRYLREITEPVLAPIRSIIPPLGFVDLSAMVALVLLQVFIQMVGSLA